MRKMGPKQTLFSGIFFLLKTGNHAKYLILVIPKMLVENRPLIAKKEKNRKPQKTLTHTKKPRRFSDLFMRKPGREIIPKMAKSEKTLVMILGDSFIRRLNRFLQDVFFIAVCL